MLPQPRVHCALVDLKAPSTELIYFLLGVYGGEQGLLPISKKMQKAPGCALLFLECTELTLQIGRAEPRIQDAAF